eukprot:XP_011681469.1 PREDICTED: leucine-rich repeat-containing protein 15-like [Strongylocentrotus purpuratus]
MAKVYTQRLRFKGWTPLLFLLIILGFGPVGSDTRSLSPEYLSSLSVNDQRNVLLNNLNIEKIELNVFQQFGNVLSLNLSHNSLSFIRNGTFRGLQKMQVLDLHRNKISTIRSGAFSDLSELTSLDLRKNELTSLSDWLRTSRLGNLKKLYLDFNNIPLIEHGDFEGLSSLRYLHLSWDGIREKGHGAFSGLKERSVLTFSYFKLLHELDLSHNHLREVSTDQFLGLRSLIELDLQHNNISSLAEDAWAGLINLLKLRLCYNRITNLKNSSFSGLRNVNILLIRYNTISTIRDDAFKGLGSLENLDLTNNRIQILRSRIFMELQNSLIYLHLKENLIQVLSHDTFFNLTNLKRLHLNSNAIVSITPGAFAQLKQLQFLNLSGNALATLPGDIFQATNQVQIIDLSGNDLTILPTGLFSKTLKLKELDLRRNSLKTLPKNVFPLRNVDTVRIGFDLKLSGNNLDCNCLLEWFRLCITANSGTGTREDATCETPPSLRGRFLSDLGKPLPCTHGNDVDNTTHLLPDPSENRTSLNALNVVLFGTLPTLAVVVVIGASVYFAIIKRRRLSQELPLDHGNIRSPGNADLDAEGVRSSLAASTFVRFSDGHMGEISNTSIDGDSFSTVDHTYYHREREELSGNDASSIDYGVSGRMVPLCRETQRSWPLYHSTDAQAGQASPRPIITRTYFGVNNV